MSEAATRQLNKTDLKGRGWTESLLNRLLPPPHVVEQRGYRIGWYTTYLWDESVVRTAEQKPEFLNAQLQRKRRNLKFDAHRHVDLLAAIFTVNRAAKRQRDLAQKYYRSSMHGFAGSAKSKKLKYYSLKDRGIATAYLSGRLSCENKHANLYLYRGEGYSFHSTLCPVGLEVPELPLAGGEEHLFIEAKPKGVKEPRLIDALRTLDALSEVDGSMFARVVAPRHERKQAEIVCWKCGEVGHVSLECSD